MIEAFTGLPGVGKTYNMVRLAYKQHKRGRKVYANFKTTFATYYKELDELYDVQNALILLDEAGIYLPAQAWKSVPFEFMREIRQHRKNSLDLWYTAQDSKDVCTALRRVTQLENNIERILKLCICDTCSPNSRNKRTLSRTFHLLNKEVFKLYDTNFEVGFGSYLNV